MLRRPPPWATEQEWMEWTEQMEGDALVARWTVAIILGTVLGWSIWSVVWT